MCIKFINIIYRTNVRTLFIFFYIISIDNKAHTDFYKSTYVHEYLFLINTLA